MTETVPFRADEGRSDGRGALARGSADARDASGSPSPAGSSDVELLRERLLEAEETLRAIRLGQVDALVVQGPNGPRTYTLVTADQSYRLLVEQMREGALTLASDGLIAYANPCFGALIGLDRTQAPGRQFESFVAPESVGVVRTLLQHVTSGSASGVIALRRVDGSAVSVHLSLSVLRTEAFDGFCAIVTDLTEETRRERQAADERLTGAVLEHAGQAIVVCDAAGRVVRANRMGADLCGSVESGRTLDAVCGVHGFFDRLTRGDGPSAEPPEISFTRPDGRQVVALANARPIAGQADGSERGTGASPSPAWVVTLTDITDRKHAEAERGRLLVTERELRAAAEEANQTKTNFLAMMSHELRTPLNAIAGHVQLLELGVHGEISDAQRAALSRVQRSQQQLMRLITDVLNFARLEAGRLDYTITELDLREALSDVVPLFAPHVGTKGLSARFVAAEPVPVRADREKMIQVVHNLVANAIKFTPPGGTITVSAAGADRGAQSVGVVRVVDTGPGIPADKREAIFEPFVQVGRTLTQGQDGVGLGLAISRALARGMGGDLTVDGEPGGGAAFTLVLPR